MRRRTISSLIVILVLIVLISTYEQLDGLVTQKLSSDYEYAYVERVIDGDTIVVSGSTIENQTHIRFLGINTPEKSETYYKEAKEFLENKILNKTIKLEYGNTKTDRYNRTLAYIYLDNENINKEIVKQGFANYYFPSGKDIYYNDFLEAWQECLNSNKNLCEKSTTQCGNCIELNELDYYEQEVIFHNKCEFECNLKNWEIKDEGRKQFIFSDFKLQAGKDIIVKVEKDKINTNEIIYWDRADYVWTKSGDTLFLRDETGKLVLDYSY